jgi:hypothetical protein
MLLQAIKCRKSYHLRAQWQNTSYPHAGIYGLHEAPLPRTKRKSDPDSNPGAGFIKVNSSV